MANSNIPSTPADGNIRTVLVPAIADITAPTLTEISAASAVHVSCYFTRGGFALTVDEQVIADERECDTIVRQAPGTVNPSLEITGIDNTNTEFAADANELAEALERGSYWYAVRRRGKPFDEDFEAGDVVSVTAFRVGVRREVPAEANSVLRSAWTCFVDQFQPQVEVAAGP